MRSLIVGHGYLAATLAEQLRRLGVWVEQVPADGRAELDRPLGAQDVDQVVVTPPRLGRQAEGLVDWVDGPRWVVCLSAAGSVDAHASAADIVLERCGTVLNLSDVFGRGGDDNVTRIARCVRRYRTLAGVGHGERLVQPLHVDDLVGLLDLHIRRPSSGCFHIAGPEAVPVAELCRSIVEILGVRPISQLIAPLMRVLDARGPRARAVIDWRDEHAPVDIHAARAEFGWTPLPLGVRIEQAVHETLA
jgi:hypothetical protein